MSIKFVTVDENHVKFLNSVDQKVQYNYESLKKSNKPFVGVIFNSGSIEYFCPLSSPKEKYEKMKNS